MSKELFVLIDPSGVLERSEDCGCEDHEDKGQAEQKINHEGEAPRFWNGCI